MYKYFFLTFIHPLTKNRLDTNYFI